ncbi:MAG: hypothetical protein HY011_08740 [Acidobacteria bacterium]|nr:hypothetical protein [Acidobacteriota bacterium]
MKETRKTAPQTPATYFAPEIEARRPDYERLAEAFITLGELHADRPFPGRLEVSTDGEISPCLTTALDTHISELVQGLDWFDARVWRRFYVEMRLMLDQLELERSLNRRAV